MQDEIIKKLEEIKALMRQPDLSEYAPGQQSRVARRYAICATEIEKVVAYFEKYIIKNDD